MRRRRSVIAARTRATRSRFGVSTRFVQRGTNHTWLVPEPSPAVFLAVIGWRSLEGYRLSRCRSDVTFSSLHQLPIVYDRAPEHEATKSNRDAPITMRTAPRCSSNLSTGGAGKISRVVRFASHSKEIQGSSSNRVSTATFVVVAVGRPYGSGRHAFFRFTRLHPCPSAPPRGSASPRPRFEDLGQLMTSFNGSPHSPGAWTSRMVGIRRVRLRNSMRPAATPANLKDDLSL